MRKVIKNCQKFFWAAYLGKEMLEADGYKTGEYRELYSKVNEGYENISPAKGVSQIEAFGNYEDYSKVILTYDPNFPMDEHSVLWIDKDPVIDTNGYATVPHDYVVTHIAIGLNTKAFAVEKVTVSA